MAKGISRGFHVRINSNAAMPGTQSPNSQLASPLSKPENGPMSSELRTLVSVLLSGVIEDKALTFKHSTRPVMCGAGRRRS